MKLYDVDGELVNVDVRQSSYPIRGKSKSILQGKVGEFLQEKYPLDAVLEEFPVPGTRSTVDFFMPKQAIVIEVDGTQHASFSSFHHGDKRTSTKFAGQVKRDVQKEVWAELNNFKFIRITKEEDLEQL